MRLPLLVLTLAPGCVFISASEHAERLGSAETGPGDSGDTSDQVQTVRFGGTFSMTLEGREDELACAGDLDLALKTSGGSTTLEATGSCLISAPSDEDLDGVAVTLAMSGSVGSELTWQGTLELSADAGPQSGSWSGTSSSDGETLEGQLEGSLKLKSQGKLDLTGTWEATRLESP